MQWSVPPEGLDAFMVNDILIAALDSPEHDLIMQQCLDILDERGLDWNAATWYQIFRSQASLIVSTV